MIYMKNKKRLSFVIRILFALLFIVLVIILFTRFIPQPTSQNKFQPRADQLLAETPSPTPTIPNTKNLSSKEFSARNNILSLLPYTTPAVTISYNPTADIFQIEILIPDIDTAKDEAVHWLKKQGFSQQTICDYPVLFYVNTAVSEKLRPQNITFSPLPPGC